MKPPLTCQTAPPAQTEWRTLCASPRGQHHSTPKKPHKRKAAVTAARPGLTLVTGTVRQHQKAHHEQNEHQYCFQQLQRSRVRLSGGQFVVPCTNNKPRNQFQSCINYSPRRAGRIALCIEISAPCDCEASGCRQRMMSKSELIGGVAPSDKSLLM